MENGIALWLGLLAVGYIGVAVWGFQVWKKLKHELYPESSSVSNATSDASVKPAPSGEQLRERLESALANATEIVEKDSRAVVSLQAAVKECGTVPALSRMIQSLLDESAASAALRTRLVRRSGFHLYLVAVPNRHEHPQLLRRYGAFAEGWRSHIERLRAVLKDDKGFTTLVVLAFFINPAGGETLLLFSYADGKRLILPRGLLQTSEASGPGVGTMDSSVEFNLS